MVKYNRTILQQMAARHYANATGIIFFYMLIGIIIGFVIYVVVSSILSLSDVAELLCILVPAFIGYWFGKEKGFEMKVKAQTILCQTKIEENTRLIAELLKTDN